jgi:putative transposase
MRAGVETLASVVGVAAACHALGIPRSTYYRTRPRAAAVPAEAAPPPELMPDPMPEVMVIADPPANPPASLAVRSRSPRALSDVERSRVRELLNSERFADCAPRTVYATLLDEQQYLCSWRTMYRILAEADEVRERRNQVRRSGYAAPELLARAPNQLWSWDITKLRGPIAWTYYYLYVILDVFSRAVVGWLIAEREDAELAEILIAETCAKEGIGVQQLTIHADRGSAMTSKLVAQLLADLGVAKTHSRPHVSNDNPYSEAQFKTLKYRPSYPDRFGSLVDARQWAREFFQWYNHEHRHSGIGLLTPAMVHGGQAADVVAARQQVLDTAYAAHPERFVRGQPVAPPPPTAVWINPPTTTTGSDRPSVPSYSSVPPTGLSGEGAPSSAPAIPSYSSVPPTGLSGEGAPSSAP